MVNKQELFLNSPYLNAAGCLGFAPDPRSIKAGAEGLGRLGAFITHPISLAARQPAESRACLPFSGGFLLHTGLANPGLRAVLKRCAAQWAAAPMPVIPHLIASSPDELGRMVQQLEGLENVVGVEIGFPPGVDPGLAAALVAQAAGELSVIACLPFESARELAEVLKQSPASMLSLAAPRGLLPAPDGRLATGRLYGPAVLPAALKLVQELAGGGLPVIGAGGVYMPEDARAMLAAGAAAVQLDAVLWNVEGVNILARW
jgi:dihydroorotate dehydrogenase (NAD+) catalytic subunit